MSPAFVLVTGCLEARSSACGHLLISWSEPPCWVSGYCLMSVVSAPFWHADGTKVTSLSGPVGTAESLTGWPSSFGRWWLLRMAFARAGCCTPLLYSSAASLAVRCQPSIDTLGAFRQGRAGWSVCIRPSIGPDPDPDRADCWMHRNFFVIHGRAPLIGKPLVDHGGPIAGRRADEGRAGQVVHHPPEPGEGIGVKADIPAADRSRSVTIFQNGWRFAEWVTSRSPAGRRRPWPGRLPRRWRGPGAHLRRRWPGGVSLSGCAPVRVDHFLSCRQSAFRSVAFSVSRFAACASGLAFGLALAVRPAGSLEAPRQRRAAGASRAAGMRSTVEGGGAGPDNARRSAPPL